MQRVKVVIGMSPRSLLRVVEHLLADETVQIVSRSSCRNRLLAHSCHLSPDVIVVNARLLGRRIDETIAEIKRRSPNSRLILVCPVMEFSHSVGDCGADGVLEEEDLVRVLPRLVRGIVPGSRE